MTTGFEYKNNQLQIDKDPISSLVYTFDWSEWLQQGDLIDIVEYTIQQRSNDPIPLIKVISGITQDKLQTYIQLEGGQLHKVYTVFVKITTTDGLIERRNFKINVTNKSA